MTPELTANTDSLKDTTRASAETSHSMEKEEEEPRHASLENDRAAVLKQISDDRESDSPFYLRSMQSHSVGYVLRRYPRVSSLLCGVLLPSVVLILISIALGLWLARLEADGEVASNDGILAAKASAEFSSVAVPDLTAKMPRLCLHLFLQGLEASEEEVFGYFFDQEQFSMETDVAVRNANLTGVDPMELANFMVDCGEQVRNGSMLYLEQTVAEALETSSSLSFNWIRCYPGAKHNLHGSFRTNHIQLSDISPEAQTAYYIEQRLASRDSIQPQLFQENLAKGMRRADAEFQSYVDAEILATGEGGCELNGAGSAWFWFTVMTTIGYGNQAPVTTGGRALLFTFGFLSILAFASILSSAGEIVAFLFDDLVQHHAQLKVLKLPLWGCLLWATLCFGWFCIIAVVTKAWKEARLDDTDFSFGDGYWFAYITTTTIGLGDIFLEPEVVLNGDLWYFPLMVLTGFTLLAAFLSKFTEFWKDIFQTKNRRSFVESLWNDVEYLDRLMKLYPNEDAASLRKMLYDDTVSRRQPEQ